MRIIVVGAGIGGLAAAGLLHRDGHQVELLERSSGLGEVGAGIQISPNAARVLAHLGLGPAFARVATTPERVVLRRWDDSSILLVTPTGDRSERRYGYRYANVYRPDLIDVLAGAVAEVPVHFDTTVTGAAPTGTGAAVTLADGEVRHADLVVGADGIHSAVRTDRFGPESPRYSGNAAYRALVPRDAVADLPVEVTNHLGPGGHLVSYFVGRDRRFLNLVCVVEEPEPAGESWTIEGSRAELRAAFATWSPLVRAMLDAVVEPVFRWSLYDREPLDRWSESPVVLLGDACHPMLPYMAQGAAQAMEDAATLSVLIRPERGFGDGFTAGRAADRAHLADRLAAYEQIRKPRTSRIQQRAYRNRTTFHLPDGPEQQRRDAALADAGSRDPDGDAGTAALDWLHGHDPFAVPVPGG
ncbi:MAG: FAD-dependent monooxygenase [Acidimicrobiales bacterium]